MPHYYGNKEYVLTLSCNIEELFDNNKALHTGFSGNSFKYTYKDEITREQIDLLHRKGLKIQLWTINDSTDLQKASDLNKNKIDLYLFFP